MSQDVEIAQRVASLYPTLFLRSYAQSKIGHDPAYRSVLDRIRNDSHPIYDVGCGAGLLAFYLREQGIHVPIIGVDFDEPKIEVAKAIAARYDDVSFHEADARNNTYFAGSVIMLDVLHYLSEEERRRMTDAVADMIAPGGVAIIRDAMRDRSWRYYVTYAAEWFAMTVRWLKAERLDFPTIDAIARPFRARGFHEEIVPMYGRTPFNNYLLVFRRPSDGMTNE